MTTPDNGSPATIDDDELRSLVADALELPVAEVTDDAHFIDDLGLDSLMTLEIMVRVEQRYSVSIEDSEFAEAQTFAAVRELLAKKLADK
jgi:acyl carrier protein